MKVQSQHDKCLSCLSPDKCCLSHCLPLNLPSEEAFTTISSHFRAKHILYLIITCKLIKAFTSIMLHLALKYPPGSPHCSYNKNNITFCREDLFGLSAAPLNLISLFLLHQFLFSHIELLATILGQVVTSFLGEVSASCTVKAFITFCSLSVQFSLLNFKT